MKPTLVKPLCSYGADFVKQSSWRDLLVVKLCICAFGFFLGAAAPEKTRKPLMVCSFLAFAATAIPLVTKFFDFVIHGGERD